MRKISLAEALLAIELLPKLLPSEEPIGPITEKSLKALDGSIQQAFITFDKKPLYWFLYQKAAALFYALAKDHAIGNGNKRCAVVVTMVFLYKNGKMFDFTPSELYDIALTVARSDAKEAKRIAASLSVLFRGHIVDI